MEIENFLEFVKTRQDFRNWLEENCEKENFCFVYSKRSAPKDGGFCYLDAVEEAICFGWIDSIFKKDDKGRCLQRFSPRRKNSNWTELNKERARRLIKLGKMTKHGEEKLPDLDMPFEIDEYILNILKSDRCLWENFNKLPSLYVRIKLGNIQSKRCDEKIFNNRLEKFIIFTKKGNLYGQWNDYGRLL